MKRKYYGRLMAIVLAVMMVLGSFCISFAEGQDGQNAQGDADQTETVVPDGQDDPDGDTTGDETIDNQDADDQTGTDDPDGEEVQNDEELLNEEPAEGEDAELKEPEAEKKLKAKRDDPKIEIKSLKKASVAESGVVIKWNKVEGAAKYKVVRTTNGKIIATTDKLGFYDKKAKPYTKTTYRVYAYDKAGKFMVRSEPKSITTGGIANVGPITTASGYQSVTLRWNKIPGALYYDIIRTDSYGRSVKLKIATTAKNSLNSKMIEYRDSKNVEADVSYYYSVWAVRNAKENGKTVKVRSKAKRNSHSVKSVRQMYQTIYFGSSATLTSHAGPSVTRTFYPGTPIVTTGFGGGQYKFWYGGSLFYANYTRVSYATCDYITSSDYSKLSATKFINELYNAGEVRRSSSDYLIWVSTYTQHLYIFKWNYRTKSWVLDRHWECSTGTAGSPTRIDTYMNIEARYSYEGGIPYWNCFSGMNAIHGKKDSYAIDGHPHSHGCVRNYNSNAGWIWDNCPMGTPVAIY